MKWGGIAVATLALALGGGAHAWAVPMRDVAVTVNAGSMVGARATVFLPPNARYCHAFVRSYLLAAGPDRWYVVARHGKLRVVHRPCRAGRWEAEGASVRFRDTGGGTRRICFEAWTPMRSGAISRHYACTADFTR
jgi:hypothetical protein